MTKNISMTVLGGVDVTELGAVLPHEHIVHTFGDPPTSEPNYDIDHVERIALPALKGVVSRGFTTIVECTTEYFGRDVSTLKRLSEKSGVHIITNTGYYGAAGDRYVPAHAYAETAGQIAARWVDEWENGIGGTGVHPGFIKIGVDPPSDEESGRTGSGPLSAIDAKLVRAAAITYRNTGLIIAAHSPSFGGLAAAELEILADEGVPPEAWIWVHADTVDDVDAVIAAAKNGAWIEFDSLRPENLDQRLELVQRAKRSEVLDRVMLSHDESSYAADREEPIAAHVTLFDLFIPMLRDAGFIDGEIEMMIRENPQRAFGIRIQSL